MNGAPVSARTLITVLATALFLVVGWVFTLVTQSVSHNSDRVAEMAGIMKVVKEREKRLAAAEANIAKNDQRLIDAFISLQSVLDKQIHIEAQHVFLRTEFVSHVKHLEQALEDTSNNHTVLSVNNHEHTLFTRPTKGAFYLARHYDVCNRSGCCD